MPRYTEAERLAFARSHKEEWPNNISDDKEYLPNPNKDVGYFALGWDGFGYVRQEDGSLLKMPHAGNVVIGKDVEIRAYVTIDRAVKGSTTIGDGTKIDHHCHLAHNVQIGKHNTLANGCIIEGSCEVGDFNTFGAGVIVQTKVKVGSHCIFGSGSVVTKDVEDYSVVVGNPGRVLRKNQ